MVDWPNNHLYCLNLPHREDKWQESLSEFQRNGIQGVERFPGTDGRYLPKVKGLLEGEVGIIHSYIRILQDARNKKYESIFIFEDDIQFVPEFRSRFQKYLNQVPDTWQIIQMGGWIQPRNFSLISENIYRPDASVLTSHALIIRRELFQELLDLFRNYDQRLDDIIARNYHKWNSYGFFPALALQRDSLSDIHGRMMYYGKEIRRSEAEYEKQKQPL